MVASHDFKALYKYCIIIIIIIIIIFYFFTIGIKDPEGFGKN